MTGTLDAIACWIDHWGATTAAMIGIPAAISAVVVPWVLEERRNHRRHIAARAVLPMALSDITQYAEDATSRTLACKTPKGVRVAALRAFDKPQLPEGLVQTIQATIEASSNRLSGVFSDGLITTVLP